jgi:outer membrane protein, multidrug efflux system
MSDAAPLAGFRNTGETKMALSEKAASWVRRRTWKLAAAGLAALAAAGCMVGPNYHPPAAAVPAGWEGTKLSPGQPSQATVESTGAVQWWGTFSDATLTSLVYRGIKANLTIASAVASIRQERAIRAATAAGLWPDLNANASYARAKAPGPAAKTANSYATSLSGVWQPDVFGGTRRSVESADANLDAAIETYHDAIVTLASEVALNYIDLRGFQQRIEIARNNVADQRHTGDITRQRFNAGLASALDVANADALAANTEAQIPPLETGARQAIYALSVLLAQQPAALQEELTPVAAVPVTPAEVPVGLPSDLLRRRPDVRRGLAEIHSATALVGVNESQLFPQFSLTGNLGLQSNKTSSFFNSQNSFWSWGPSMTWPVFDAGRIRANVAAQNAALDQSVLTYQQTVLTALQQVEDALVAFSMEQRHRAALDQAVAFNRKSVDLSTKLYTAGETDFLSVIVAQNALFNSEDALVQSQQAVAADLVNLYQALGGGWEK